MFKLMWVFVKIKLENNLFSKELWKRISEKGHLYLMHIDTSFVNQILFLFLFLFEIKYQKNHQYLQVEGWTDDYSQHNQFQPILETILGTSMWLSNLLVCKMCRRSTSLLSSRFYPSSVCLMFVGFAVNDGTFYFRATSHS